jgi:hypothetical protein
MTRTILIIVILITNGSISFAQNPLRAEDNSIRKQAAVNNIKSKLSSPFGTAALSNFISNISLSSFLQEGVNGKIELHGKFKYGWTGGLSIDQKISKVDKEASPFSLTGISPGTTVQVNLQKMLWKPTFDDLSDAQIKKINDAETEYAKRNKIADARMVGLREISINGTEKEKRMALEAFNAASFKEPFFVNAKFGFTKTSFTYTTDSVNLTQASDAYITPTFSFSLVKAIGSGFNVSGYFAVSYSYSENYKAADALTFNIPFGTTPNYYSNTLAFGKPAKQISNLLTAEFRKNIFINNGNRNPSNIAISPAVNVDMNNKMLGLFLPVYFIRGADEKGKLLDGLQGGVRFGYLTSTESGQFRSFNKGFIAQLIISAPLDFLDIL